MTNSESGFMFRKWHLIPFFILLLIIILLSPFILYCLDIKPLPLSKDAPSHFSDYVILSQDDNSNNSGMLMGYDLKTRKSLQLKTLRSIVGHDRILGFGENYLVKMTSNAGEPNKLVIYNCSSKAEKVLNIDCKYASSRGFTVDQEGFYFANHNTLKHYSMKSGACREIFKNGDSGWGSTFGVNKKKGYAVSFTYTEFPAPMGNGIRIAPTNLKRIDLRDKSVKDLGYVCDFPMISNNDRHFSYKIGKKLHIDNIETGSGSVINYDINQCGWSLDGRLFFFFALDIDVTGGFRERLIYLRDEFWTETYYMRQRLAIYDPESKIMTDVLDFSNILHNVFMIPRNWPIAGELLKE